ncbi:uncharacterized protein B0J16DRAFT_343491 [Fusarium flagelliforme]|uniref:uncharacterized protein n=1 Tax=Fusarium flagelliforme TaxID=2675880 RepID=UPI001E8E9BE0|nr:uncharacterized protein B0J16DRAFT_343491 [Fusarium flagelliforme]KAH7182300.1 hypothetical protein B0J16DRAFT_343491 [Fusarium flagelliforme]
MPTATEFFGITAHNLGPLTTTFTAPSFCAISINDNDIVFVNATSPYSLQGQAQCGWATFTDCFPSGDELDSFVSETSSAFFKTTLIYFSPGVACPTGWKTVGALAHAESGKMSASGVLEQGPPDLDLELPRPVWVTDAWRNMLGESETLAYCCPSGYMGDVYGGCVSTLGPVTSYSYSQHCVVWHTNRDYYISVSSVSGLSYSHGVWSYFNPSGIAAGKTTTMDFGRVLGVTSNDFADIAVATWVQAVPLIYKKSDMDKKEGDGETGTASATETVSATETSSATGTATVENAASTLPRQGSVSTLGLVLGCLAGMGLALS